MDILGTLIESALDTSAQAHVGVSLIYIYFVFIVTVAIFRIGQNLKEDH